MTSIPHLPALRRGRAYESLEKIDVKDFRTGTVLAQVSLVNAGVVRKDLARLEEARQLLRRCSTAQMYVIAAKAGDLFLNGTLPLGNRGHTQSPQEYIETLSATSGLPWNMVRRNMAKIHAALTQMPAVLQGLTRGLPDALLEKGYGVFNGAQCCFYPVAHGLGVVMPSNSPAVNSLWLPALGLRIPVMLKPGREEPWTPYRLLAALTTAGCPPEALGFYPTDHEGAGEIIRGCGRALVFGDQSTTKQYAGNTGVQVHGPGFSKILIGADQIENWQKYLDVIVSSIADNGGRSCINVSAVVVPKYAREIAEALAQRLGPVAPLPAADDNARLSGFANPKMADAIDAAIEQDLKVPGATEVTSRFRNGPRKVNFEGGTFLRPTIVRCDSMQHPLANREFLFPYASVVEVPQVDMLKLIGPTLALAAITQDPAWREQLLNCPHIERLHLGAIPTTKVSWNQPHEGNLFEFLYRRRSLEIQET